MKVKFYWCYFWDTILIYNVYVSWCVKNHTYFRDVGSDELKGQCGTLTQSYHENYFFEIISFRYKCNHIFLGHTGLQFNMCRRYSALFLYKTNCIQKWLIESFIAFEFMSYCLRLYNSAKICRTYISVVDHFSEPF